MLLQMMAYMLAGSYVGPVNFEKSAASLILCTILGPASVALAWISLRHLGKQWRFQAALSQDHELVQTGPYRVVRHPIYASMLGMLLATGLAWTWWPMFLAGLAFFFAGTEIRVRAEDGLLAGRFQASFAAYRSRVPAYLPFIR
jgi:protein-S-isoprenylcysteine O-methyltransferase Ste14